MYFMSELNILKPLIYQRENWINLSIKMKNMSKHLRQKDKYTIEIDSIEFIQFLLQVAKNYNINMESAWDRWYKKAYYKKYY